MAIEPTIESALGAQRADLLNKIGNSAQATQKQNVRKSVDHFNDQSQKTREAAEKKDDSQPVNPRRGRNLNISI
jgi:hypothetical protein